MTDYYKSLTWYGKIIYKLIDLIFRLAIAVPVTIALMWYIVIPLMMRIDALLNK
jgi:hypothetical protein